MSEKSGKSVAQLRDEMSKGKITVEDVTKAFEIATSEGGQFYKGMEEGAGTLSGKFSTLLDGISNMSSGILGLKDDGTILEGSLMSLVEKGVDWLNERLSAIDWVKVGTDIRTYVITTIETLRQSFEDLTTWYNNNKLGLEILIASFGGFITALAAVRTAVWLYTTALTVAIALQGGFAAAIAFFSGPIGWVVIGLTLLIGAIIGLVRNWEKVPQPIKNVWNQITGIFNVGLNVVNGVISAFRTLVGVLTNIKMPAGLEAVFNAMKGISGARDFLKGKIPGFANGVRNFSGGLAVVGERGPELVNLPKGADVFTNEESRKMTAGGGGITIETMNIKSGVDWELGASYMAQKLRLS